jgi:hypothetical protein
MEELAPAYALMLRICGAGILIDALERMVTAGKYRDEGPFSWIILRQRLATLPPPLRGLADQLFQGAGRLMGVLVIRLIGLAAVVLNPVGSGPFAVGLTVLLITQLYVSIRSANFGATGSDAITLVICGGAWLATVAADGPLAARAGLWFIAAQACLSYVVGGVSKLTAPKWRSGQAIVEVLSTYTYGSERFHALVRARPWLSRALCWSVMLWETTFPLVLIVPRSLALPLLGAGVLFHLSTAALMGINLFVFAFASTYVAIWAVRP